MICEHTGSFTSLRNFLDPIDGEKTFTEKFMAQACMIGDLESLKSLVLAAAPVSRRFFGLAALCLLTLFHRSVMKYTVIQRWI